MENPIESDFDKIRMWLFKRLFPRYFSKAFPDAFVSPEPKKLRRIEDVTYISYTKPIDFLTPNQQPPQAEPKATKKTSRPRKRAGAKQTTKKTKATPRSRAKRAQDIY